MKIKDIGGEFALIERIKTTIKIFSKDVMVGIGDDAAVLEYDNKNYMLFTTDTLVENRHFKADYFSPMQIGMKAIEQNVSDIAAMGGMPKYALVSLGLPQDIEVSFVDELIKGMNKKSGKYRISIVGGNITGSKKIIVGISLIGFAKKKYIALRSGAKAGDIIFCSGDLGKASIGLELLKNKLSGYCVKSHLEPKCRLELAGELVKAGINSMIDISDGAASEVRHLCRQSGVGAIIYAEKLPISEKTLNDYQKIKKIKKMNGRTMKKSIIDFALEGGEDYELIFTAERDKLDKLKKFDVNAIGEIVDNKFGVKLIKDGKKLNLNGGFDHFRMKKY